MVTSRHCWLAEACKILLLLLLVATGRVARVQRVCLSCNSGALGDERHLQIECGALASLRSWLHAANACVNRLSCLQFLASGANLQLCANLLT